MRRFSSPTPGRTARLRQAVAAFALAASLAAAIPPAHAEDYPARTITVVSGPSSIVIPRLLAERLQKALGKPVIVETRPGAGGEIAARSVVRAEPDGYTLWIGVASNAVTAAMRAANYDLEKDFAPVALLNIAASALAVRPSLPATTPQELLAYIKANPGKLNCGHGGKGTVGHFGCEILNKATDGGLVVVPYRDANSLMNAMLGDQVQIAFLISSNAKAMMQAGTIRGLAVATPQRTPLLPGLPTMAESGFPGVGMRGWSAVLVPAQTPAPIIKLLNENIVRILADPEVHTTFERIGLETPPPLTPAGLQAFIREDIDGWNRVIDVSGVQRGQP